MSVRLSIAIFAGAFVLVTGGVLAILSDQGVFAADDECAYSTGAGSSSTGPGGRINGVAVIAVRAAHPDLLPPRTTAVKTRYRSCGETVTQTSYTFSGIDPHVALATERSGSDVLIAPGRLPTLEGFPLRDALYGDQVEPRLPRRCRTSRRSVLGFLHPPQGNALVAHDGNAEVLIRVQRDTVVTGRSTFGLPEIRANDRAAVTGRTCRQSGTRVILADRLTLPRS